VRTDEFGARLLSWSAEHGRRDLPWQHNPTPYRVWVSEIMLQQTQVATVIPYYLRYMARFPGVVSLADAPLDEVLHHWSGLGYYARARNLHGAACRVRDHHDGRFPEHYEAVVGLPGVGASTAGAILALACGQRHAILDGNVKRVLTRFHAVDGWPGQAAVARRLWALAERYTPRQRIAAYTQAIMDLGSTVCTRSRPSCGVCPLAAGCRARRSGRAQHFPAPRPRRSLPLRASTMLLLHNDRGEVYLERRPPAGIWGGLWAFPEIAPDSDPARWCRDHIGCGITEVERWPVVRHTFTHFRLDITPMLALAAPGDRVLEGVRGVWYNSGKTDARGLAAPVQRLLERLQAARLSEVCR
jgi:A/G-specific adenine glycosylase